MTAGNEIRIDRNRGLRSPSLMAFVALLTVLILATVLASPPESGAATDLQHATVGQKGRAVVFDIRPGHQFNITRLERQPDFSRPKARYLCVEMRRKGARRISRICIGGKHATRRAAGFARVGPTGKAIKSATIPVSVKGSSRDSLSIGFVPGKAHVTPGKYSWRVLFSTGACAQGSDDCRSSFPRTGFAAYRVRPVDVVGCTGGNGQVVNDGPGKRKLVSLTFDDGPSSYTPQILDILKRKKVKATFFMLGDQVAADPSTARRVLASGHEIGNHSSDHPLLPSYSNIARAGRKIRSATGFKPCLFRPPYGALNSSVVSSAEALDMKSVIWNIDTVDWSTPGTGAIRSRASAAGSGSIVLMHDGGGPRSQTVAALPGIIHNLRSRGYGFTTVTKLLGNRFIYRPR